MGAESAELCWFQSQSVCRQIRDLSQLVETRDAQGRVNITLTIVSDPMLAFEMGKATRQKVMTDFTLRREAQGIGQVYQQLFDAAV